MTYEEQEELRQDLLEADYQDQLHEIKMRNDFNYFLTTISDQVDLDKFSKDYNKLKSKCEHYGHTFNIADYLD